MEWWIWHAGVLLALPCLLGVVLAVAGLRRAPLRSAGLLGLLVPLLLGAALVAFDVPAPRGLGWLSAQRELPPETLWLAVAGLLALEGRRGPPLPTWRSLPALALVPLDTLGAWLVALLLVGGGALEAGRAGRAALLAGLGALLLAEAARGNGLWCWSQVQGLTGLGADPASLVVDLGRQALAASGWALLLLRFGSARSQSPAVDKPPRSFDALQHVASMVR